jgi:hypothetical protein
MMKDCPVMDPCPRHPDPVDPAKSDMLPYGRHAGQNLSGTQMSATQLKRGGLVRARHIRK